MFNVFDIINLETRVVAVSKKGMLCVTWNCKNTLDIWKIETEGFDHLDSKSISGSNLKFKEVKPQAEKYIKEFTPIIPQQKKIK